MMSRALAKKVTVVVAVYAVERELKRCLDSLLAQTLPGIEVIAVLRSSPDRSGEIVESYAERHPGTVSVVRREDGGLAGARNTGIAAATGEFVGFVDADDWVEPDMFELLYERAAATGADVVVCEYLGGREGTHEPDRHREGDPSEFGRSLADSPRLLRSNSTMACNKLFRRVLFAETGIGFPEGVDFEDLATVYPLLAAASRIEKVSRPLYHYTLGREGAISSDYTRYLHLTRALALLNARFADAGLRESLGLELERLNVLHLLTGRYPDLLACAPREVTNEYIDAAFSHLDEAFPGWRRGIAVNDLCANPLLRVITTHRPLLKALAAMPPGVVLGVARRLGLFEPAAGR